MEDAPGVFVVVNETTVSGLRVRKQLGLFRTLWVNIGSLLMASYLKWLYPGRNKG
jgi:hypothetical protein